jgi:hypothetical protein
MKSKWMIKNKDSYFKCMTGIGPCFGATEDTGQKFDDRFDAAIAMTKHSFAFSDAKLVEVKEKKK